METTPVAEANARLEACQKAGNAPGMAEMHIEDAVLLPAGGEGARGREAILPAETQNAIAVQAFTRTGS